MRQSALRWIVKSWSVRDPLPLVELKYVVEEEVSVYLTLSVWEETTTVSSAKDRASVHDGMSETSLRV